MLRRQVEPVELVQLFKAIYGLWRKTKESQTSSIIDSSFKLLHFFSYLGYFKTKQKNITES